MNDHVFSNGTTYKRHFCAKTSKNIFNFRFFLKDDKQLIFDLGDGLFVRDNFQKDRYYDFGFNIKDYFSIRYDNYGVESIGCRNNDIEQVQVGQLWQIKSIDLSINKLKYFFSQRLSFLQSLNLHRNKIQQINLVSNKELKFLDLSDNLLNTVDLSKNLKLQSADLQNNLITNVVFNNNLSYLNLRNNFIQEIQIPYWSKLRVLNISQNPYLKTIKIYNNLQHLICKQINSMSINLYGNVKTVDGNLKPNLNFSNNITVVIY